MVLIVLDAVRADHLRLYGYERDTMPALERFARSDAVVIEHAVTNAPTSGSSHATMFTGLYPPRHGAHKPLLVDSDPPAYMYPLRDDVPTLAELFADAGYWTVGLSGNFGPLDPQYGLARGFAHYESERNPGCRFLRAGAWSPLFEGLEELAAAAPWAGLADLFDCRVQYRRADQIATRAIQAVEAAGDAPFFLFVNLFDAHDPYEPPAAFRDRFPGRRPELGDGVIPWATELDLLRGDRDLTGEEKAHFEALYDDELAFVDTGLARLLAALRRHPRWGDMVIAVTADHGEAFGEHRLLKHSASLYEEMIRVPMLIKPGAAASLLPGPPGSVVPGPMQPVDLFPTLLELAGLPVPPDIDGLPFGRERHEVRAWSFVYTTGDARADARVFRELRSIEIDGKKLIESTAGGPELYDLSQDPGEHHNLAAEEADLRDRLLAALGPNQPYRLFVRPGSGAESREVLERLRSLGYIR